MVRKGKILIVDDSELVLQQATSVLSPAGYDVITTSQAVGASRHLSHCDLAIIDFHMPGFDGQDLARSMRESLSRASFRCLLYMYTSDEDAARDFRRFGFDGSLVAKGNRESLLEQVDAVFRLVNMRGIGDRVRRALKG
jgi:two-component system OmpR family response regulator